jgi:hypothetical protein
MITVFYNNKEHLLPEFTTRIKYELLSRENDLPSLVDQNIKRWYKNGKQHRDNDLPAYVNEENGTVAWRQDGLRHRENDKPAYICKDLGMFEWFQRGKHHRDGNNPAVIWKHTKREYWKKGKQYKLFKLENLLFVQKMIILMFLNRYSKNIWSPSKLAGVYTKKQIFEMVK